MALLWAAACGQGLCGWGNVWEDGCNVRDISLGSQQVLAAPTPDPATRPTRTARRSRIRYASDRAGLRRSWST